MTEKELLAVACEQFLGKNVQDIKNVVLQTLEGHLRSILGETLPSPGAPLLPWRSITGPQTRAREGCRREWGPLRPPRFLDEKLKHFPQVFPFRTSGDLSEGEGIGAGGGASLIRHPVLLRTLFFIQPALCRRQLGAKHCSEETGKAQLRLHSPA